MNTEYKKSLEHNIEFYSTGIKEYLKIKSIHQRLLENNFIGIDKILIEIADFLKRYGTKHQTKYFKDRLKWYKEQSKIEKKGLNWCDEMIKGNKNNLLFYKKQLQELTEKTSA